MAEPGDMEGPSPSDISSFGTNATNCAMFHGDEHLCNIIVGVKRAVSVVSMLGCLATIVFIVLFRKYLVFIQRLIMFLSVAAFIESIAFIMGDDYEEGPLCTFQAWMLSAFSWAVLAWNACITFNLYMTALKSRRTDKFEWAYHFFSWGISFIIACLPLIGSHYGPAGMWCWIKDNWGWRFGTYYLPLFVSLVAMIAAYIYIMVMVKRQSKTWEGLYDPDVERKKQLIVEDLKPLRWYPFAYIATSIFPMINRIQNAASSQPVFALTLLQVISNPLYGLLISVIFFMNKEIRSQLTIQQIKMAALNRKHGAEIHEYPTSPGTPRTPPGGSQEMTVPLSKLNSTSYSKMQ